MTDYSRHFVDVPTVVPANVEMYAVLLTDDDTPAYILEQKPELVVAWALYWDETDEQHYTAPITTDRTLFPRVPGTTVLLSRSYANMLDMLKRKAGKS